jgi:hypothetical protein
LAAKVKSTTVVAKGGLIFGALTEGAALDSAIAATKTELDAWVKTESAPNTWAIESTPMVESYFNEGRETYFIIDLSTMKLVAIHDYTNTSGDIEAAAFSDLTARLQ